MTFEWDEAKNRTNKARHGISFEVAVRIFKDPHCVTKLDWVVDDEIRWKTTGLLDGAKMLVVIHTWTDGDIVRVISAQKATHGEVREYTHDC